MRRPTTRRTTLLGGALMLAGCLGTGTDDDADAPDYPDHDFVFGQTGYAVETTLDVSFPDVPAFDLSVSADGDAVDWNEDVTLTFELTNESEEALRVMASRAPPNPFGTVPLEAGDGTRLFPWSPVYEESPWVHPEPHLGPVLWNDLSRPVELAPGETARETYRLSDETHRIRPGTYAYDGSIEVSMEESSWTAEVDAQFEIEANELAAGEVIDHLHVADVEQPSGPRAYAIEPLAPATETHPGLVEIAVTNDGEEPITSTAGHGPIEAYRGEGPDESALVLLSADMYAPGFVERRDDWWSAAFVPPEGGDRGRSVDPGEEYAKRYVVAAPPDGVAPESGQAFTFQQADWQFDLEIRSPNV